MSMRTTPVALTPASGDGRLAAVSLRNDIVLVAMTDRVRPPFSGWLTPSGSYDLEVEAGAILGYRPSR